MTFVFLMTGWLIGILAGSFFLFQSIIILFFGLPTTIKMKIQGIINNANRQISSYFISLLILVTLFITVVWGVTILFPNLTLGFWIGVVIILLLGFNKVGQKNNMPEYIEKNMTNINLSFLYEYIESVKVNHSSSKAKDDHVAVVSEYIYISTKKMAEKVKEIQSEQLNDAWHEIVSIAMRLYKEDLEEHWSDTSKVLSTKWKFNNLEEQAIQKEIFIALITLELTYLDSLFQEHATMIQSVINYLIDMYGNKEHIETLVNDIYYPAAKHALETFTADETYNSVICSRLRQPSSEEVIFAISKLYAPMMGKWYIIKGTMDQENDKDDIA